jgi:hypothetical protein
MASEYVVTVRVVGAAPGEDFVPVQVVADNETAARRQALRWAAEAGKRVRDIISVVKGKG